MKIIDRYLLRELVPPFLLGIVIFTFVLLMSQILRLMELIVNKGVPALTVLKLIFFLLPSILVLTVPMSVFLTCIVTFGRWSSDNELTAAKSGGIGVLRLSYPVAAFSLAVYLLTSWLIIFALPSGNQAFRRIMFEIVRTKASIGLREKVFNDDFEGLVIYVDSIPESGTTVMRGVIITDYRPEKRNPPQEPLTIIAEEGWLLADEATQRVIFQLRKGAIHSLSRDMSKYQKTDFSVHNLTLNLTEEMMDTLTVPKGLREMNLSELRAKAEEYRLQGVKSHAPLVEIHKKFAIPFSTLIFGYLGISMGTLFRRGEKIVSFAVSIAIAIVYYVFLLAGEPLGKQGKVSPFLSMWTANIFFSLLTCYLLWLVLRERSPFGLKWIRGRPRLPRVLAAYVMTVLAADVLLFALQLRRLLAKNPGQILAPVLTSLVFFLLYLLLWAVPTGIMLHRKSNAARWFLVVATFPAGLLLLTKGVRRHLGGAGPESAVEWSRRDAVRPGSAYDQGAARRGRR